MCFFLIDFTLNPLDPKAFTFHRFQKGPAIGHVTFHPRFTSVLRRFLLIGTTGTPPMFAKFPLTKAGTLHQHV